MTNLEAMKAALPGMDWVQYGDRSRILGVPRGDHPEDAMFGIAIRYDMWVARIFGKMYEAGLDEPLGENIEEQVAGAVHMVERLVGEAIDEAKAWTDIAGEVSQALAGRP